MLAEILAYNIKSALCRSASFAFSFVSLRLATASLFKIRDPARETSQSVLFTRCVDLKQRVFTNLVPRVLFLRAGRREPWERGCVFTTFYQFAVLSKFYEG